MELSADNNSAWHVPWRDAFKADEGKKKAKKAKSDLPVNILGTPNLWVDESGKGAWAVLRALVTGGHSSRRLQFLQMAIGAEETTTPVRVNDGLRVVWLSVPDLKRRVVPAETIVWFRFDDELCAAIARDSTPLSELQITLHGQEIQTFARSYPLDPAVVAALAMACSGAS